MRPYTLSYPGQTARNSVPFGRLSVLVMAGKTYAGAGENLRGGRVPYPSPSKFALSPTRARSGHSPWAFLPNALQAGRIPPDQDNSCSSRAL